MSDILLWTFVAIVLMVSAYWALRLVFLAFLAIVVLLGRSRK